MPQIKSRKKDLRQARARHDRNVEVRRRTRLAVRAAREAGDPSGEEVAQAYKALDKAAKRGVIHPRTAARRKSRLLKRLQREQAE